MKEITQIHGNSFKRCVVVVVVSISIKLGYDRIFSLANDPHKTSVSPDYFQLHIIQFLFIWHSLIICFRYIKNETR